VKSHQGLPAKFLEHGANAFAAVRICPEENSRLAKLYALLGIAKVTYDISNSSRNAPVQRRR
jgi:hypothetical protein